MKYIGASITPVRRQSNHARSRLDPRGSGDFFTIFIPVGKPLTLVAYESNLAVSAYVDPFAIGESLRNMPLFLKPGAYVEVPLEATYQSAFAAAPRRWRRVLEAPPE
jgi:hypothetical protein